MITWNSRSFLPKIEEIERIKILPNPEFIFIIETWLNSNIENSQIDINGYNINRYDGTVESGKVTGGGLVMYYKATFNCTPLNYLNC